MKNLDERLDEMASILQAAHGSYEIWKAYEILLTDPGSLDVMNVFGDFFGLTLRAHFVAWIIGYYELYEEKADTLSLPGLYREARALAQSSTGHLPDIQSKLKRFNSLLSSPWRSSMS